MPESLRAVFQIYCIVCSKETIASKTWRWRADRFGVSRPCGLNRCRACDTVYDAPVDDGERRQTLPDVAP